MGVLGSGENGVNKFREQGAWGQKDQGAGSKGNHFREQGAEDSYHFIKQFHIIIRTFSSRRFARLIFCHIFCISTSRTLVNHLL